MMSVRVCLHLVFSRSNKFNELITMAKLSIFVLAAVFVASSQAKVVARGVDCDGYECGAGEECCYDPENGTHWCATSCSKKQVWTIRTDDPRCCCSTSCTNEDGETKCCQCDEDCQAPVCDCTRKGINIVIAAAAKKN